MIETRPTIFSGRPKYTLLTGMFFVGIFAAFFSVPSRALAGGTLYFSPASVSVSIDQQFSLSATVDPNGNSGTSVDMYVSYDSAKFRLDTITANGGGVITRAASIDNVNGTASIAIAARAGSPVTTPTVVATFSFHALAGVSNSSIAFTDSSSATATGISGNALSTLTPATVTVTGGSDTTPPTLTQVTAVPSVSRYLTPNYTFSSTEAGTIGYAGDCSSSTTAAVSGSNTITFNTLAHGTHSNCSLIVTDAAANPSSSLAVPSFLISYRSDLNQDGTVNIFDYSLLHTNFNTTNSEGDVDLDGTVNIFDYSILHSEFGGT